MLKFRLTICIMLLALTASAAAEPVSTQRAVIRTITVEVDDVFDGQKGSLYRTLNALKINTRESVVRRELLFSEGEQYNQFRLDESARFLRALPFFRKVTITPKFEGEFVDILVKVQDQWTLIPQVSIGFGGGGNTDKQTVGLLEKNLFGFGKRAEVIYGNDEGRNTVAALWDDFRFLNTDNRLFLSGYSRSDGWQTDGLFGSPFRSLVQEDAWGTAWDFSDTVGRLFNRGDERYIYRRQHNEAAAKYTKAYGEPSQRLNRVSIGYSYSADQFTQADASDYEDVDLDPNAVSNDLAQLADDREFSGPLVGIDMIQADYISLNYVDRFEIVQDFNLGSEYSAQAQLAPKALGSSDNTFLVTASARRGLRLGEREFMRAEIGASTRLNTDGAENTYIRGQEKYFNVLGPQFLFGHYVGRHTIAAAFSLEFGDRFDRDRQLLLGADEGLRGYEGRTFEGDKKFLVNLEDRFHLIEDVLELMSIGGAVFTDIGGASYDAVGELLQNQLYTNVGVGLRLAFTRSSGGGIVRIDLAFPLREIEGTDRFEPRLLVRVGQLFDGRLASEQYGLAKSNVEIGVDR